MAAASAVVEKRAAERGHSWRYLERALGAAENDLEGASTSLSRGTRSFGGIRGANRCT